ncbi:MAG TPA: hypothetical protein VK203_30435, partial [Nostocaceae cyanobacterium]|nr:hypothetical protein [Nostocaceae cyanobacterium]
MGNVGFERGLLVCIRYLLLVNWCETIGVNLTKNGRLETASTQTRRVAASRREGHLRGFENLDFSLVRVGGL